MPCKRAGGPVRQATGQVCEKSSLLRVQYIASLFAPASIPQICQLEVGLVQVGRLEVAVGEVSVEKAYGM